jgi:hypothetical protein
MLPTSIVLALLGWFVPALPALSGSPARSGPDTPFGPERTGPSAPLASPGPLVRVAPDAGEQDEQRQAEVRQTRHYDLHLAMTRSEADDLALLLEAAWPTFKDFFQAEPRITTERLKLDLFPDKEAWRAGIEADHVTPPAAADRSWFSPETHRLYVYRAPIEYITHAHVLYGACLQFHGMLKAKNADLARTWYIQGIAEVFSVHTWHDKKLELAVRRRVATIDLSGLAWELVRGVERPWTEQRLELPCVRWAAAAYARERYPDKFKKLALGLTGSKLSGEDFMNSLGESNAVGQGFREWLEAAQIPLEVLAWSFEELADGRVVGRPAKNELAVCRLKDRANAFEATIPLGPPEQGSGALLISWKEPLEIELARLTQGALSIERYREGKQLESIQLPLPKSAQGSVHARVERDKGLVRVLVEGEILHEMEVAEPSFGLAAHAGEVVFEKVSWR